MDRALFFVSGMKDWWTDRLATNAIRSAGDERPVRDVTRSAGNERPVHDRGMGGQWFNYRVHPWSRSAGRLGLGCEPKFGWKLGEFEETK